jgi:ribonuclease P protein component
LGCKRTSFPRDNRLLKPADFERVFAHPCKVSNRGLTFLARSNELGAPRLGLAIAKRHVKTAVARNRIKRQIRESFRLHRGELGPLDVIALARPGAAELDRHAFRTALDRLWQRLIERCAHCSSS